MFEFVQSLLIDQRVKQKIWFEYVLQIWFICGFEQKMKILPHHSWLGTEYATSAKSMHTYEQIGAPASKQSVKQGHFPGT